MGCLPDWRRQAGTYTHKDSSLSIKDFFNQEFGFASDRRTVKLLDCAVVNFREAYLAFEDLDRATGKREVFAVVCLLDYKPNDYYNFGYKDMEESEGPYYYNCPERILRLLTPTTNEYALKWRKKCWERIESLKSMPKLTQGDIIEFQKPMPFSDGTEQSRLQLVDDSNRRGFLRFQDPDRGGYYRVSREVLISTPFRIIRTPA